MTAFADELYDRLSGIDAPSDDLRAYCDAIAVMFAEVEDYVRQDDDGNESWSHLIDPELAGITALLWLAQLAGVNVPIGTESDEATLREVIEAAEGRRRGTPAYMAEVAQRSLTGTKTVKMFERFGSAYLLHMVTRTDETPDPAVTEAAVRAVKPAGIVLSFLVSAGVTWDEPTDAWGDAGSTTWSETIFTVP